jgi:hypothetical protein
MNSKNKNGEPQNNTNFNKLIIGNTSKEFISDDPTLFTCFEAWLALTEFKVFALFFAILISKMGCWVCCFWLLMSYWKYMEMIC